MIAVDLMNFKYLFMTFWHDFLRKIALFKSKHIIKSNLI